VLVITRPENKEALNCLTEFHANKKYNLEIYTRKGFHEKVIIIDDVDKKITYIGSANFFVFVLFKLRTYSTNRW